MNMEHCIKNKTLGESLHALKLLMKDKGLCEEYVMLPLGMRI